MANMCSDGQVVIGTKLTEKRINISGGSSYEPIVGYSRAVIVGKTLYISGTTASSTGGPLHPDAGLQTKETLLIIRKVLEENGSCIEDVVRTRMFVVDIGINGKAVGEAHGIVFSDTRPVSSMIGVAGLIDTRMLVEIECEAIIGCGK
jgi:enamine deaminase RidA (YjgF/YER057c/UK114 family)